MSSWCNSSYQTNYPTNSTIIKTHQDIDTYVNGKRTKINDPKMVLGKFFYQLYYPTNSKIIKTTHR